jgi:Spy/CpxP family protein refolding chaperone
MAAAVAAAEMTAAAAEMAAAAATMATAAAAAGISRSWGKHGKAERSARGDGQKGRFTNHDTLLLIPGDR